MSKQNITHKKEASHSSKHRAPQAQSSKHITVISEQEKATNPILHAVYKRIRNLNKKLQNIEFLQSQPREHLIEDQLRKIQRKPDTLNQIKKNEEFVTFYKSILLENGGKTFDPTEVLIKIATLVAVGQYVEKNKGLLFKPEISNDFKNLYESLIKKVLNSQKEDSIPQRINNIVSNLRDFIDNEKNYDICRDFMSYDVVQKKSQQVEVVKQEQKKVEQSQKEQKDTPKSKEMNRKMKNKGKKSWIESSSDQQQQKQTKPVEQLQQIKKQTQKIEEKKESPEPQQQIKSQERPTAVQQIQEKVEQQNQIDIPLKQKQSSKKYQDYSKKSQRRDQNRNYYGNRGYENRPYYEKGYKKDYDRGENKGYGRRYEKGYRGYNKDYVQSRSYKGKYYQDSTPYPHKEYEEEDYHKPPHYSRTRYRHTGQQRGEYGKDRRRHDSDSSLSSTPQQIRGYNPRDKERLKKPVNYVAKNK